MKTLTKKDIGRCVTYTNGLGTGMVTERGKIKSFDNKRQVAWVVYKANGNWDMEHWKDYTAQITDYRDLDL